MITKFLIIIEPPECPSWQQEVLRSDVVSRVHAEFDRAMHRRGQRFALQDGRQSPTIGRCASRRQMFAELHLESSAAPDSLHEKRLKNDGLCEIEVDHRC